MTTRISYRGRRSTEPSGELAGEQTLPEGSGKAPGLVVIQEWWGVNAHVRDLVDRFAAAGFLAFAPDLYHGDVVTTPEDALKKLMALDKAKAVSEIGDAVAYLRAHERSNGKVGAIGFCVGGVLAFASACHVEGLGAVVPFYGAPPDELVNWTKVTAPIQAHFAEHDAKHSPALAKAIQDKLAALGKPMELFVYDAQHAFANDTRPEVYDAANAKLALDRSLAFLRQHLT